MSGATNFVTYRLWNGTEHLLGLTTHLLKGDIQLAINIIVCCTIISICIYAMYRTNLTNVLIRCFCKRARKRYRHRTFSLRNTNNTGDNDVAPFSDILQREPVENIESQTCSSEIQTALQPLLPVQTSTPRNTMSCTDEITEKIV